MFSLGVKSLLHKPNLLFTILQTPAKWCSRCSRVYNNNPQYLSFSSSYNNAFFVSCRRLSTAFPKKKNISDAIRSRPKRKVNNTRRPVSFNVADSIYSSHGISDSAAGQVVNTKTTPSGIGLKSRRPHILSQMINFKEIRNEMLLQFLKDEVLSPTKCSPKQIRILEDAFVYKLKELTIHEMFSVARCFFQIHHRAPKYLTSLFEYIDNNFDKVVSVEEGNPLSQTMFYIYFHGSCPETLLQKIEGHLLVHVNELSMNDISLACLGYFRANRRIQSFQLLDQIAEKSIEQFHSLKPQYLIHMLKSFRHAGYSKITYFERLADLLVSCKTVCDLKLNQVMHIMMSFASTKIYQPKLTRECIQRSAELVQSLSSVRTKDLGKIVWAAGTLGVDDQDLSKVKALVDAHSEIEKSTDRTRSVSEYPESISDTVVGSAFLKIFPEELIRLMLEEKTVRVLQGLRGLEKKMQMHFIHHTVNIECPNYSGPKLKQFMVEQFELKNRGRSVQFELDTRPGLLTLFQELTSILGEKKVHCHMILPHFTTADIEIHLDADNQPLFFEPETISTESEESYSWKTQQEVTFTLLQMLQNPLQNLSSNSSAPQISRRIAIEVCGRNQCALNQNRWLLGIYRTKLRQLSAIGYEVLLFMPEDIADLKNEICSEKRKEWVLQKVIQKLNINCGIQNQ